MTNKKQKTEKNLPAQSVVDDASFDEYVSLPDNIDALGERMQWLLIQDARSHFLKGVILAKVLRSAEDSVQTFAQFLTEYCGGMSRRNAYNYIRFARQCSEMDTVKEFAESNWSKVITLMNSFSPDDLAEIDEKGIDGKPLLDYEYVSAREFQQIINDYKSQLNDADTEAHNKYKSQLESAEKRIKALEMQIPKPDDDNWASEPLSSIEKSLIEFMNHMNYFCFSPELVGKGKVAGSIRARVEGLYQTGYRAFLEFIDKWESYTGHKVKK